MTARMSSSERTTASRARWATAVVLALTAAAVIGAVLGHLAVAPTSSWTATEAALPSAGSSELPRPPGHPGRAVPAGVTLEDGVVPEGVTAFDDEFPAVAYLDPALLSALRRAATAAADDGVDVVVNSGWRSREYQRQLLGEAVSEYGSEEEAALWVATPDTSAHVSGDAVDVGPADATGWLSEHGDEYGLCQVYRNEPWHFELRAEAADAGCPAPYADPTEDPRMQP